MFEDGQQTRDFIHVRDVAKANVSALEKSNFNYEAINVGTGKPLSIAQIATTLSNALGKKMTPLITNKFRIGDIRHCYADIEAKADGVPAGIYIWNRAERDPTVG
jgi:dTDP-L-rhamnose 4-epimerase